MSAVGAVPYGHGRKGGDFELAATFYRATVSGVIDDQSAHNLCCIAHESPTVGGGRAASIPISEIEVGFVQQRGCPETHESAMVCELAARQPVQLRVKRDEQ